MKIAERSAVGLTDLLDALISPFYEIPRRIPRSVNGDECGAGARGCNPLHLSFSDASPCGRDNSLFSWLTRIKIEPGDVERFERVLLFIAFILLCFGFFRLLFHLACNGLVH